MAEPPHPRSDPVDEFERERALLGFSSFIGQYAGEHTAAPGSSTTCTRECAP